MDGRLIKYYYCNYRYFKCIDLLDDSSLHLLESNITTYIFCVTYFIYGIISSPIPNYIRKYGILAYLSLLLKGFGLFGLKCIVNSLKSLFCCFGKERKSAETEESINLDKAEVESAAEEEQQKER